MKGLRDGKEIYEMIENAIDPSVVEVSRLLSFVSKCKKHMRYEEAPSFSIFNDRWINEVWKIQIFLCHLN